eukprot:3941644-Rhodomonas_salina.23
MLTEHARVRQSAAVHAGLMHQRLARSAPGPLQPGHDSRLRQLAPVHNQLHRDLFRSRPPKPTP